MKRTAEEVANLLNGQLEGDPSREIRQLQAIDTQDPFGITFYSNSKYKKHLSNQSPRTIIVSRYEQVSSDEFTTLIRVDNVYAAFAELSHWWNTDQSTNVGEQLEKSVSHFSIIDDSAQLGAGISIKDFSKIGKSCKIGNHVTIDEHVYIGDEVVIGDWTHIKQGVCVLSGVQIGANCIIYPNAVIGTEGFGHALNAHGHKKIVHHARVIIEDDVEIGSNTVIDRGTLRDTIIRRGAKLDNLIQIAHGVEIGEGVVIAAQSGISGSSKVGPHSMIGGQVGIAGHVHIAPGSQIQAKSGIASNIVEANRKWYGYPILSYLQYLRSYALFKRLPEIFDRIQRLEKRVNTKD